MLSHPPRNSHTHRLTFRQMQQQPTLSYTDRHMLTHCLPPAVLCLHCQSDAELNQQSPIVCMGNGSLSRSTVASGGTDGLRVPGQVVIPRMWGCLWGVLPGAEWPLNAPRPHPQRAYRAWLLSLKTQPASLPLLLPLFMLSG